MHHDETQKLNISATLAGSVAPPPPPQRDGHQQKGGPWESFRGAQTLNSDVQPQMWHSVRAAVSACLICYLLGLNLFTTLNLAEGFSDSQIKSFFDDLTSVETEETVESEQLESAGILLHNVRSLCYLGVAGMPLFRALSLSPILSIHVPQLKRFPPLTKPVAGSTRATTLNPANNKRFSSEVQYPKNVCSKNLVKPDDVIGLTAVRNDFLKMCTSTLNTQPI